MKTYQKGSFIFIALIFSCFLLFFILSLGYGERTRFVPLLVVTPGLLLSIFLLIGEFSPRLLSRLDISLVKIGQNSLDTEVHLNRGGTLIGQRGLLIVTGYLIGFSILILLVGFLIAIPICLFVFIKVLGRQSWLMSLAVTAGTWAFIYLLFVVVMNFEIFRGILFDEIVIL